jgi:hypothetical protein
VERIVLTDEQAKVVAAATTPVSVCDAAGNVLGVLRPAWTEADIAEAKKRLESDAPRLTTAEVLAYLRALEGG